MSITALLKWLGLTTLADRRVFANQGFLRELVNGSIDCPVLLSQLNFRIPNNLHQSNLPVFHSSLHHKLYSSNKPMFKMMLIANDNPSFYFP